LTGETTVVMAPAAVATSDVAIVPPVTSAVDTPPLITDNAETYGREAVPAAQSPHPAVLVEFPGTVEARSVVAWLGMPSENCAAPTSIEKGSASADTAQATATTAARRDLGRRRMTHPAFHRRT
jgi:hypothetical protein